MAIVLKCRYFKAANEVTVFCAAVPNNVTTIVSILYDTTTAQYVLFYT